ncbi:MAG: pilin [Patescibacteria group bacterium]
MTGLYNQMAAIVVQCTGPVISGNKQCTLCDFIALLDNIKTIVFEMLAVVVMIMILYGAYRMILSAGDPGGYEAGKKAIASAFIGLAIILTSFIIVSTLLRVLAPNGGITPWNQIQC